MRNVTDDRSIWKILAVSIGATALAAMTATLAWWTGTSATVDFFVLTLRRVVPEFLIFLTIPVVLLTWKARVKSSLLIILGTVLCLFLANQIPRLTGPNDNGGKIVASTAALLLTLVLAWLTSLHFEKVINERVQGS